jgi:uncharacterized protein (TIGR00369 family)
MTESTPPWLKLAQGHMNQTAFFAHLKGEVVGFGPGRATMRLPYGPHLVGNPDTGVVHGGVITALLDHASGAAVMAALKEPMAIATLDLRIDYMKPATPGEAITAEVTCLKVTHEVAFVRGSAYHASADDPVAICTGAFMLMRGTPSPLLPAKD